MQSINVKQVAKTNTVKNPDPRKVKLSFDYTPSADGINLNLLVLLHGLGNLKYYNSTSLNTHWTYPIGDSKKPFSNLGKQLKLPQTATLSVQAPEPVPYMDGCFQWFPSFDMLTGDCKFQQ